MSYHNNIVGTYASYTGEYLLFVKRITLKLHAFELLFLGLFAFHF